MLPANALRILDVLGVYSRIQGKGYNFENFAFHDSKEAAAKTFCLGNNRNYGYKALRTYRRVLLAELRAMVGEANIPLFFGKEFSHVVSEDAQDGVKFAFIDGSMGKASFLVGADGLFSAVREYITSVKPIYTGQVAVTGPMPVTDLDFNPSDDYDLPAYIFAKPGLFVMAPQNGNGSEILVGTQTPYPEQDRAGWDALNAAKPALLRLVRKDMLDWPEIIQSALRNVEQDALVTWPYYAVPKLESWASPDERVIILGDAAHALPPSAGQRISQLFEDSLTLATFLSKGLLEQKGALKSWQHKRRERIDRVINLTRQLNNARLPQAERDSAFRDAVWEDGQDGALGWLYNARVEEDLQD